MEPHFALLLTMVGGFGGGTFLSTVLIGYLFAGNNGQSSSQEITWKRLKAVYGDVVVDKSKAWDEKAQAFIDGEMLLSSETLNNKSLSSLLDSSLKLLKRGYGQAQTAATAEELPAFTEAVARYEEKTEQMGKSKTPVTMAEQEVYAMAMGQLRALVEAYTTRSSLLSSVSPLSDRQTAREELKPFAQIVTATLDSWDQVVSSHEMTRIVTAGA